MISKTDTYMQKTYWWRIILIVVCTGVLLGAYLGPCDSNVARCLGGDSILVTRTFFHFALSLLVVSLFLFFVRDTVFLKWLRFAMIWFAVAAVLIAATPTYTGGWMSFGPTKESVSIWLSMLFVAVSSIKLVWDMRKAKGIQGKSAK
jgi:hypothetical protein